MRYFLVILAFGLLSGCGSTGVVQMEPNKFMVSVKKAKVGFVTAAEEKANVYRQANEFCASRNKSVETINLEAIGSGSFRQASATLEFRCVENSAT
jgi:hypothetical protein